MRIIIVGDGKVGYTLAEQLSKENHDVVIIDKNIAALRRADEELDVLCIEGNGATVSVLKEATVERADLLIAATSSDELNMLCCLTGRKLGAQHTIARIRNPEYSEDLDILQEELGLTMVINPEEVAAREISRILRFPHAISVEGFARGRVEMVAFHVLASDSIVGQPIASFAKRLPAEMLFCAVDRDGEVLIPNGSTELRADDIAYIVGLPHSLRSFFKSLGRNASKVHKVMVVGGGRIAYYLTRDLMSHSMEVKIIELDRENARALSHELPDALIISGDGTDPALLETEGLAEMDAFIALTGRDEDNLMIALHAHQSGLPKVIAKINRVNYTELIRRMGVDSVVSPKLLAANLIVRYVRSLANSEGSAIHTLRRIAQDGAEALEFVACARSHLLGQSLRQLPLRKNVLIAGIVRGNRVLIPRGDTVIQAQDRVLAITQGLSVIDLDDLLESKV